MASRTPDGWHAVTPRLVVRDTAAEVAFLKQAFRATGEHRTDRPSEIRIGDSMVMVSGIEAREAMPALLYVYADDVDATYRRALELGAESLEEPNELPYGDRRGTIKDACGITWQIATRS